MKETKNIKGYVIRVSPYKEYDAMVTILSEEGLFSFSGRGIKKNTSKNFASCQPLCFSSFQLTSTGTSYSLKESKLLSSSPDYSSFEKAISLSIIEELSGKIIKDDDCEVAYEWLGSILNSLNSGLDALSMTLIYFAQLIKINGYGLNVSSCIHCGGKKNIVGVDYINGGFVCERCADKNTVIYNPETLKTVRYIFMCGLTNYKQAKFDTEICYKLIIDLSIFLEDTLGFKLKSVEAIKTMLKY